MIPAPRGVRHRVFRPTGWVACDTMSDRDARLAELEEYHRDEVTACVRCPLSEGRTHVVVGSGDPDADLMFVGEAPGYHEDRQGIPFVGQAGKLLTTLIEGIGLSRDDVFIANVLKCRPPGNRDPLPAEIASCEPHLFRQISLIRPAMVCTLGNFATKLLSGRPDGISRVHGHELPLVIAGAPVLLYPLFHPAAALYTRAMLSTLEADFARIPGLLAAGAGAAAPAVPEPAVAAVGGPAEAPAGDPSAEQLGLF
jgi:uracil-DNA glycosylase